MKTGIPYWEEEAEARAAQGIVALMTALEKRDQRTSETMGVGDVTRLQMVQGREIR